MKGENGMKQVVRILEEMKTGAFKELLTDIKMKMEQYGFSQKDTQ